MPVFYVGGHSDSLRSLDWPMFDLNYVTVSDQTAIDVHRTDSKRAESNGVLIFSSAWPFLTRVAVGCTFFVMALEPEGLHSSHDAVQDVCKMEALLKSTIISDFWDAMGSY